MTNNIHYHYEQLTPHELAAVDEALDELHHILVFTWKVPMDGGDIFERLVDATAKAVIESREQKKRP